MENKVEQITVSLDFKLSKNFNSKGGAVSYTTNIQPQEGVREAYNRAYDLVDRKLAELEGKATRELL